LLFTDLKTQNSGTTSGCVVRHTALCRLRAMNSQNWSLVQIRWLGFYRNCIDSSW